MLWVRFPSRLLTPERDSSVNRVTYYFYNLKINNMNIGDKVIISPLATHSNKKPGIFQICDCDGPLYILNNGDAYSKNDLIPADPLEIGDKVVIKENISSMNPFPHGLVSAMLPYKGRIVTISAKRVACDSIIGEGEYYYFLQEDPNNYSWPLCAFNTETIIKQSKNYENRLQKQETSVVGRSRELRFGVCCRKHRARVEVSSLKHKKVIGRG